MYLCRGCKTSKQSWTAQCPSCNAWGSLVLDVGDAQIVGAPRDARAVAFRPEHALVSSASPPSEAPDESSADDCELPIPITCVSREHVARFITNMPALDHVLGGGLVPGCSVLIGGAPGAGKTTLAIQALAACARWNEARVLFVTAEELVAVVAERADRVGAAFDRLYIVHESDPDRILRSAEKIEPAVIVVDSISTMARLDMPAAIGSVAQVRASAELLCAWCREHGVVLILIGHVTKDGAVAGPNTLKHLVDTVLHLDLIENSQLRVLRAHKNRNGDTGAVGRFMMGGAGLESVGSYRPDVTDGDAGEIPDASPDTSDREPQDTDLVDPSEFAS